MFYYRTSVEIGPVDGPELDIVVSYSKIKACKGSTDGRYGPKLEPDEPAYIDIEEIKDANTGEEITLSNKMEDRILQRIIDSFD